MSESSQAAETRTGYLLTEEAYHLLYRLHQQVKLTTTLAQSRSERDDRYEPTPPVGHWAFTLEQWADQLSCIMQRISWQPR